MLKNQNQCNLNDNQHNMAPVIPYTINLALILELHRCPIRAHNWIELEQQHPEIICFGFGLSLLQLAL